MEFIQTIKSTLSHAHTVVATRLIYNNQHLWDDIENQASHLYHPMTVFLIPNLSWVNIKVQVNLIFLQLRPAVKPTP